jgi:hypothetical protein
LSTGDWAERDRADVDRYVESNAELKMKKQTAIVPVISKEETPREGLKSFALVELYGHARIVGLCTVDPADFPGMVRVDVPDLVKDGKLVRSGFTRYFGKNALYSVTPIDESAVRELLPSIDGRPHRPMTFSDPDSDRY